MRDRFLLDTLVTIKTYDLPRLKRARIEAATEAAFARMKIVERRLNGLDSGSETAKINRNAGQSPVKVSDDMWEALGASSGVAGATADAFNPTIGPVTKLWRFGRGGKVPPLSELRRAVALVKRGNIQSLMSDARRAVRLEEAGMMLDLGGVAKGVAVDRAAELLRRRGLKHALVTSTSSTKALGSKPGGRPWLIGIQSPRPKTAPGLIGVVELARGAISTSGDYQQFFIKNGRRYHHILDPKTGYPAQGFMSVTVVTDGSAAYADALSTGLAVMGRRRAMTLVKKMRGVGVVFIDGEGRVWVSAGLRSRYRSYISRLSNSAPPTQ